ncbi:hypothetical protein D9M69_486140 [compost metagenome]
MRATRLTGSRWARRWSAPRATCGWRSTRTTRAWRWARSRPTAASPSPSTKRSMRWTRRCPPSSRCWKARRSAPNRCSSAIGARWSWPSGWRHGAATSLPRLCPLHRQAREARQPRRRRPRPQKPYAGSKCFPRPCSCTARRCRSRRSSRASAAASRVRGSLPRPRCRSRATSRTMRRNWGWTRTVR